MAKRSFDFVTVTAESPKGFSIRETLHFHCFNPRGVCQTQTRINDAINALVDAKIVKSGAIIAYGGFDNVYYGMMFGHLDRAKKNPSRIALDSLIRCYEDRNAKAVAYVLENGGTIAPAPAKTIEQATAEREELVASLVVS